MKSSYFITAALVLAAPSSWAQSFRTLRIFQYEGADASRRKLVLARRFNLQGKVVAERCFEDYRYYQSGAEYGRWRGSATRYTYQDTLLLRSESTGIRPGDSLKTFYTYTPGGRLASWTRWTYSQKLKPGVDKGITRPGGCELMPEDFEEKRTWQQGATGRYTYDAQGHRTSYALEGTRTNEAQRWRYNRNGQLLEHLRFFPPNDTLPDSRTQYAYDSRGRLRREAEYGRNGELTRDYRYRTVKNVLYATGTYQAYTGENPPSAYRIITYHDSKGRIIKEIDYAGRCSLEARITTTYRPNGRIAQIIIFTCRDKRRLVQDYVYE
ncbi:MAG: hypothetical protein ACRYFX_05925 [Janthinobacterium lividum]